MAIVDVSNRPWVVETVPDNVVAEFTDESLTVEVPNGTPLVEFRCCEGGGGAGGALQFQDEGINLGANDSDTLNFVGGLVEATRDGNTVTATIAAASDAETDEGIVDTKGVTPESGAFAYDRLRHPGQHSAGKGTEVFSVTAVANVFTVDCNESNVFQISLLANSTIASPINPIRGQTINVLIKQDVTGGRTVTWGSAWTFFNGIPTLSTEAYATDMLSCQWDDDALKWRCTFLSGFTAGVVGSGVPYTLANIGTGGQVYKQTVDELGTDVAQIRSIVAGVGVSVTQNANDITIGSTIRIFVQPTEPVSPLVGDLWFW